MTETVLEGFVTPNKRWALNYPTNCSEFNSKWQSITHFKSDELVWTHPHKFFYQPFPRFFQMGTNFLFFTYCDKGREISKSGKVVKIHWFLLVRTTLQFQHRTRLVWWEMGQGSILTSLQLVAFGGISAIRHCLGLQKAIFVIFW